MSLRGVPDPSRHLHRRVFAGSLASSMCVIPRLLLQQLLAGQTLRSISFFCGSCFVVGVVMILMMLCCFECILTLSYSHSILTLASIHPFTPSLAEHCLSPSSHLHVLVPPVSRSLLLHPQRLSLLRTPPHAHSL